MPTNTGGGHRTARAHRHVAEIPAMYRVVGNEEWTHGLTTNISASGVLLQAAWPLALRARIEMRFQIPEPIASFPGGQVTRLGEVVRFGQSTPTTPFPTAARFVEIDRVDPSLRDPERNDTARRRGDEANARALTTFVEGVSAENRKLERLLQALDRQACELERELQGLSLEPVTATTVDGPLADEPSVYVANTSRRFFHHKECRWARHIPGARLVEFASRVEAEGAGYTSCMMCRA